MKTIENIGLANVQDVYNGPEGRLWELIMGQQIHVGGFSSSMDLAQKANIQPSSKGVDFCCCNGAGMRFLIRFCNVTSMVGVDATETVINQCKERCQQEGLSDQLSCVIADVCDCGLKSDSYDFVWGEDAWCYVEDKPQMIQEAARIIHSGGTIAFTDWIEGPNGLTAEQSERFLKFMKFPNILNMEEYQQLLELNYCDIVRIENTERFAPYVDLYLEMVEKQLTYDVLSLIGFDMESMLALGDEMKYMQQLAHAGNITQGLFVAKKK